MKFPGGRLVKRRVVIAPLGGTTSAAIFACLMLSATTALAAVPEIDQFLPRGGRRGTEVEVIFSGPRLGDARGLLFYEPGIAVKSLEVLPDKRVKTRLALAATARWGPTPCGCNRPAASATWSPSASGR